MPRAEIIAIGTEILLGEIQDTNTRHLARQLRDLGVDLYRTSVVGDNEERIAQMIRESLTRCEIVITTGGLGPTVDDPTRQAVARAMDTVAVFSEELWQQVQDRFTRFGRQATPNNRRQAYIPQGAIAVENPVGTAPSFIFEKGEGCVISLPGVPREMEYLFEHAVRPYLREKYHLTGLIKARVLHVSGMGESSVDDLLEDLEKQHNPTLGLLAHPGQVDVRITAKGEHLEEVDAMIAEMETIVRSRLGSAVFGADGDTLENVVYRDLLQRGIQLDLQLAGTAWDGFTPPQVMQMFQPVFTVNTNPAPTAQVAHQLRVELEPGEKKQMLTLAYLNGGVVEDTIERQYGGPPQHGPQWAWKMALDWFHGLINHPKG